MIEEAYELATSPATSPLSSPTVVSATSSASTHAESSSAGAPNLDTTLVPGGDADVDSLLKDLMRMQGA